MTMTKEQLHTTAVNYMPRLGGFATKLADAYLHADSDNKKKIEEKFMDDFERAYRMWHTEGKSMRIKTNEATPNQINYLVAKCEGIHVSMARGGWFVFDSDAWAEFRNDYNDDKLQPFKPSTNWAQGGPIIQREELSNLKCYDTNDWGCNNGDIFCDGPTPLIAAMRCYVASKLGDEVEIPEELK